MKKYTLAFLFSLSLCGAANAQFLITPKEGEAVKIEGNVSFSADADGKSWSVGESYDAALDLSKIDKISLYKEEGPKVGDYFYSDGSWSTTLDSSKTPVGIVFYVGNPAVDDEALQEAYPGCVHGLVVSLTETKCEWQEDYSGFDDEADMTVGEWIEDNTDYASIATRSFSMTSVFNKIMGYNNTMGIDEFNDGEYGWDYEVRVGSKLSSAVKVDAPEGTSGWYIPSIKEVSLICSGDLGVNIDDLGYEDTPDNANALLINQKMESISGAQPLSGVYWSSTEYTVTQANTVQFSNGIVMQTSKGGSNNLRAVLAF